MTHFFLGIFNRGLAAGWLVLAVLVLRLVLQKAPKWAPVLLWGLVALRLVCPFSIESPLSLLPGARPIPERVLTGPSFALQTGVGPVDTAVNGYLGDRYFEGVTVPAGNGETVMTVLAGFWCAGVLALGTYAVRGMRRLRRRVAEAVRWRDDIFVCEGLPAPFLLGLVWPCVYLPADLDEKSRQYVLAHEQAHLRRRDHWWKSLGFALLTVYWFQPLLWLAYALLCRDIELACDEAVIKTLDAGQRADYSQALLTASLGGRLTAGPLAFGEVGVKRRIRSVLRYHKPAGWLTALALLLCAGAAVCFLTDPARRADGGTAAAVKWFDYWQTPEEMPADGRLETALSEFPGVTFRWYAAGVEAVTADGVLPLYGGLPVWSAYFCDLTGDGLPELCSTLSFGSGLVDTRVILYDYANGASYQLADRGVCDYTLRQDADGRLVVDKRDYGSGEVLASGPLVYADGCIQVAFDEAPQPALPPAGEGRFSRPGRSPDRTLLA